MHHSNYEATSLPSRPRRERERERESGVQSRVNDGIVPVHPRLRVYKLSNLADESVPPPPGKAHFSDRSTHARFFFSIRLNIRDAVLEDEGL